MCYTQHSKERVHGTIVAEKQRVSDKTEFILVESLVFEASFRIQWIM